MRIYTLREDLKHSAIEHRSFAAIFGMSRHIGERERIFDTHDHYNGTLTEKFQDAPDGSAREVSSPKCRSMARTPPEGSRTMDQHMNVSIIHACSGFDFSDLADLEFELRAHGFQPDGSG